MIESRTGDILESDADFIVCPVNCMGTMGSGLAKQFKERFPRLEERYRDELADGNLTTARPYILFPDDTNYTQGIILFATKWHWKNPSQLKWITYSLWDLIDRFKRITFFDGRDMVIAFPKIGCGLGGLNWEDVKEELEWFDQRIPPCIKVVVYDS